MPTTEVQNIRQSQVWMKRIWSINYMNGTLSIQTSSSASPSGSLDDTADALDDESPPPPQLVDPQNSFASIM